MHFSPCLLCWIPRYHLGLAALFISLCVCVCGKGTVRNFSLSLFLFVRVGSSAVYGTVHHSSSVTPSCVCCVVLCCPFAPSPILPCSGPHLTCCPPLTFQSLPCLPHHTRSHLSYLPTLPPTLPFSLTLAFLPFSSYSLPHELSLSSTRIMVKIYVTLPCNSEMRSSSYVYFHLGSSANLVFIFCSPSDPP